MMNKKIIILILIIGLMAVAGKFLLFPNAQKTSLNSPSQQAVNVSVTPSETLKTYSDPSGFSFNYPDNLSLAPNELTDATYAEVQLTAKGVGGSLILKITDSKFKTLDEWAKSIKDAEGSPKETKLGSLKALEIKTASGIKLASVDQGVLFSIDVSQNDFWIKVYNKILPEFTFAPPSQDNAYDGSSDVSFEGEEVVE